jgi:2-hydroxy-3-oxopropionate reductase
MSKPSIGFIGVGITGRPRARNLREAGYPLVERSRSRPLVDKEVAASADAADSPREAAERSEMVITRLPNPLDAELVALRPDTLIEGARPGLIYAEMSTIAPTAASRVAEALAEQGVRCLDAPVSGGDIGPQQGTLAIMIGGDGDKFAQMRPVFEVLGRAPALCGPMAPVRRSRPATRRWWRSPSPVCAKH